MLLLGRGPTRQTALVAVVALTISLLTISGCAKSFPAHAALAEAVAVGREAWGLSVRVARFCGPASDGTAEVGQCHIEEVRGPAGASFYDEDHSIVFRFVGEDDTDIVYRSKRDGAALDVALEGRLRVGGALRRVHLGSLAVGASGPGFDEGEVALRAEIEGGDTRVEIDEVRYRIRERGAESFYRTFNNRWQTRKGDFVLDDGLYEGQRAAGGRWHFEVEGILRGADRDVAHVSLGGPNDARRAILAHPGGAIDL